MTPVQGLTTREHAVLELLAQGLDTPDMAQRLCMSEKTVRNHLSTIYSKLGVPNRVKAVLWVEAHREELNTARQAEPASQRQGKDWTPPWARAN
jgi:DNA-binding NarL/FixJ family response regulator